MSQPSIEPGFEVAGERERSCVVRRPSPRREPRRAAAGRRIHRTAPPVVRAMVHRHRLAPRRRRSCVRSFAIFPLLYVLSASLKPQGTLTGSNQLFSDVQLRQLRAHAHRSADPVRPVVRQHARDRAHDGLRDGLHRRARGVRVLADALHRPPRRTRHDRGGADVPAAARGRRDLPAHDDDRRLVPGDRPEHARRG